MDFTVIKKMMTNDIDNLIIIYEPLLSAFFFNIPINILCSYISWIIIALELAANF